MLAALREGRGADLARGGRDADGRDAPRPASRGPAGGTPAEHGGARPGGGGGRGLGVGAPAFGRRWTGRRRRCARPAAAHAGDRPTLVVHNRLTEPIALTLEDTGAHRRAGRQRAARRSRPGGRSRRTGRWCARRPPTAGCWARRWRGPSLRDDVRGEVRREVGAAGGDGRRWFSPIVVNRDAAAGPRRHRDRRATRSTAAASSRPATRSGWATIRSCRAARCASATRRAPNGASTLDPAGVDSDQRGRRPSGWTAAALGRPPTPRRPAPRPGRRRREIRSRDSSPFADDPRRPRRHPGTAHAQAPAVPAAALLFCCF